MENTMNKKEIAVTIISAIAAIGGAAFGAYTLWKKAEGSSVPTPTESETKPDQSQTPPAAEAEVKPDQSSSNNE